LHVILKLVNIEVTPKKPECALGAWHVEGQLDEQICATALYYYDIDSITLGRLVFRQ
jgi:hypothetical protein